MLYMGWTIERKAFFLPFLSLPDYGTWRLTKLFGVLVLVWMKLFHVICMK